MPSQVCPYLGLIDDPDTALNFATRRNHCHRAIPPDPVDPRYQGSVCLSEQYSSCPVYTGQSEGELPAAMRIDLASFPRRMAQIVGTLPGLIGLSVVGLITLIAIGFAISRNGGQKSLPAGQPVVTMTPIVQPTGTGFTPSQEAVATPRYGASGTPAALTAPTVSPSPTGTFTTTPPACPPPEGWVSIEVQPGETLGSLAQVYGVAGSDLLQANCRALGWELAPGMRLNVPSQTATPTVVCGPPPGWISYTVQSGDTLYVLGVRFGLSVYQLQLANCLGDSTVIYIDQTLWVPYFASATPVPASPTSSPPTASPTTQPPPSSPTATATSELPTPTATLSTGATPGP